MTDNTISRMEAPTALEVSIGAIVVDALQERFYYLQEWARCVKVEMYNGVPIVRVEARQSETRMHYEHGGRPMTLRECAEAEEPSSDKREGQPTRTMNLALVAGKIYETNPTKAVEMVLESHAQLERELNQSHTENAPPGRFTGNTPTTQQGSAETSGKPGTEARHADDRREGYSPRTDARDEGLRGRIGWDTPAYNAMMFHANKLEKELAARQSAIGVPQGWMLVPVRPTPEMIVAAANVEPPTTAGDVMTRYSVMLGACRTPTDRRTDKCGR